MAVREAPRRAAASWWSLARDLAISAAVGVVIMLLVALGRPSLLRPRVLAVGAVMGLFIGAACTLLLRAFAPVTGRLEGGWRRLAVGAVLFAGGVIGWFAAAWVSEPMFGVEVYTSGGGLGLGLVIVGLVAVLVGSLFVLYEALRARLERSIEDAKANEYAVRELELAAALQRRLLPERCVTGPGWRVDVAHRPARWVAGDLYHVVKQPDGTVVVAAGDVAGKGMAASLVMASVTARLPLLLSEASLPEVVERLGAQLAEEGGVRHFVALALVRFDAGSGAFELVNAGLPDPYHLRADGSVVTLQAPGVRLPLGVRAPEAHRVLRGVLQPGDRLLLLTDGIPEAPKPDGEPLGYAALEQVLSAVAGRRGGWLEQVAAEVERSTGGGPEDDWTLVLLERTRADGDDGGAAQRAARG